MWNPCVNYWISPTVDTTVGTLLLLWVAWAGARQHYGAIISRLASKLKELQDA